MFQGAQSPCHAPKLIGIAPASDWIRSTASSSLRPVGAGAEERLARRLTRCQKPLSPRAPVSVPPSAPTSSSVRLGGKALREPRRHTRDGAGSVIISSRSPQVPWCRSLGTAKDTGGRRLQALRTRASLRTSERVTPFHPTLAYPAT